MRRILPFVVLLAACGRDEPAPPPANPIRQQTDAARANAREAEQAIDASAKRMEAEAAAAAGDTSAHP